MRLGVVVLVASCGAVLKPPEPDRRLDVRTAGTTFESDRGYAFAALPEPDAKVVRVDIRYPVGAADDPAGKEGLAHLVEHLLYDVEYSIGETKTSISAEMGKLAVSWNAYTAENHTTYQALVPPERLDDLLKLEANRMAIGCGGLTPAIVAREREVVLNELRERSSGAPLQRAVTEAVYPPGHPYRGVHSIDSVRKLELADVCQFLAGPYQRGKAIVIASGAVDGAMLQQVARHFARVRKRQVLEVRPPTPPVQPQPGTVRLRVDVDEPLLLVTWPLPPLHSHEYRMLELAWPLMAPRLEWFATTYNWGHSATTMVLGGADAPVLALGVVLTGAAKQNEAIEAVRKAFDFSIRLPEADEEYGIVWRRRWEPVVESLIARWESLAGRNEMMAEFMHAGGSLVTRVEELAKSRPAEVEKLALQWLEPRRAKILVLEPSGTGGSSRLASYQGGAETHGIVVDGALADRPLPVPKASLALNVEHYHLGNGLSVMLWPHGNAPVVHGRLVVHAGAAHEPAGKDGMSLLVGADAISHDAMVFATRDLATRVDDSVGALAAELRSPGYELSDEAKQFLRGRLVMTRAQERTSYARDLAVALYGAGHPYARGIMTEDSLSHIDRDSVMKWARGRIVAKNATMILAGKFDPALVKKHVAYFADHVTSGDRARDPESAPRPRRTFIRGETWKPTPVVAIQIHFVGGNGLDADHARRLVLEQVLGIRLSDLRGKYAVTYGFSADYSPRRSGGLWTIGGDVDAARAGEASAAIVEILDELRRDPESYRAAFVLARQQVLERLLLTSTDANGVMGRLVEIARFDVADDYTDRLVRKIANLALANVHELVVRELAADTQVFGAFGNSDAVDAAIKAARGVTKGRP